jgi:hypothetical protein
MPYSNVPKNLWDKMDRCTKDISGLNKRTGKPYTKAQKVAICYSSVVGTSGDDALAGDPSPDFTLDADGDGIITIITAEDGSPVYMKTPEGARKVTWRPGTLRRIAATWKGTKNGINHFHDPKLDGTIVDAFATDIDNDGKDELVLKVQIGKDMKAFLNSQMPDVWTSVEAIVTELIGDEIADGKGAGNTFVVAPSEPACSPDNCYVVGYKMVDIMATPGDEDDGCCGEAIEYEMGDDDFAALLWHQGGGYWDQAVAAVIGQEAAGAKLTTKTRNALPTTAFCGPDRSFPAHDAAHVRNGLARLKNSNFSDAVKARIHACLVRRAKKYGIEVSGESTPASPAASAPATTPADSTPPAGAQGADPMACVAAKLDAAVECFESQGIKCDSGTFTLYGHTGDNAPWSAGFQYYSPPQVSTSTTATMVGNVTFNGTNAAVSTWTNVASTPGWHAVTPPMSKPTDEASGENQEPPAEDEKMSDEQQVVALKAEIENLKKERDELAAFRAERDQQERYAALLDLKHLGVDVKNFEPFDLAALRTIAAGIKAGKVQNSGAQATKPTVLTGEEPVDPKRFNLAKYVAGEKEPSMSQAEIDGLKAYEDKLLGMKQKQG